MENDSKKEGRVSCRDGGSVSWMGEEHVGLEGGMTTDNREEYEVGVRAGVESA